MNIIEIIKAALFGIVEGITEWLPVSSTGHMILLNEFLKLNVSEDFWNLFLVVIQFGAIIAVIIMYWNKVWPLGLYRHRKRTRVVIKHETIRLWVKFIISCIPAAIVGVFFDDWLDEHLYNWKVLSVMLILVGVAFIIIETRQEKTGAEPEVYELDELTIKDAALIGIFQLIAAVFPGTSRSGATIVGALLLGISRGVAMDYSFILAIPVMAGASLLKFLKYGFHFTAAEGVILATGMLVAFVTSMLIIRFLVGYVRTHNFKIFGWYRIVLGALVIIYFGLIR